MANRLLKLVRGAYRTALIDPGDRITFVSYPRSGHHWLTRLAADYCGRLYGCVPHVAHKASTRNIKKGDSESFIRAGRFTYCEYYGHCRERPCPDRALIQKNHDFGLSLRYRSSDRYVVLIRNPLHCIRAFYEYKKRSRSWPDFAAANANYWCGFVDKWVLSKKENILVLTFEDLAANPNLVLAKFLGICGIPVREELMTFERSDATAQPRGIEPAVDYSIVQRLTGQKYEQVLSLLGSRR